MRAKFVSICTFGLALLVAVSTNNLCGCSVIGASIGASGASSRAIRLEVENVKPGTQITIITKQGSNISGKYVGLDSVPAEGYAESYAKGREQNREKVILPKLGDSIIITPLYDSGRRGLKGKFLGFDLGAILVRRTGKTEPNKVFLNTIRTIVDSDENIVRAETLKKLMAGGKIPLLSVLLAIYVQSEGGKTRVAMDKVHAIRVLGNRKRRALTGFLIGAPVDALVAWSIFFADPDLLCVLSMQCIYCDALQTHTLTYECPHE